MSCEEAKARFFSTTPEKGFFQQAQSEVVMVGARETMQEAF
jgi:hypothetical protein